MDAYQADGSVGHDSARRLQADLDRTLAGLLPQGTRAALINYPNHHNVGDPAVYVGTLRSLQRIGVRVSYRCEHSTYSRRSLATELRRGTEVILINGGGNLGDQYQQQQGRERVLRDFPSVRTIQLAQSIWFENAANLERFATLVRDHRDLTLLLRDQASLELARRHFDAPARLCPDLAFGLGPLARPTPASQDIVWLLRSDRESASAERRAYLPDGIESVDWLDASPAEAVGGIAGNLLMHANRWLAGQVGRRPIMRQPLALTFAPLARRRLAFGCRLLSRGRVVVSDRLHGIVLALLLGIPAVALDNRNHKVSNFIATWLSDVPTVRLASDPRDALDLARRLLDADRR